MPAISKLQKIANERGQSIEDILKAAYQEHGKQESVADALGVSRSTVSIWIARLGLVEHKILVKEKREKAGY